MITNVDSERTVVGTFLVNPQSIFAVADLSEDDFTDPECKFLFSLISKTVSEDKIPDIAVISPMLVGHTFDGKPALEVANDLVMWAVDTERFVSCLRSLKEFSGRREMVQIANEMNMIASQTIMPILPFNEDVTARLNSISAAMRQGKVTSFSVGEIVRDQIERLKSGTRPNLIDTGLLDLNRTIGGWARGSLVIMAGRPSMGKSACSLSMLRQAAKKGVTSLFLSMEMPHDAVSARLLSDAVYNSQTPIHYDDILQHKIKSWEVERLDALQDGIATLPMRIDDHSALSISEITVRARRYQDELEKTGQTLDVICVDHLGYARASDRYKGQTVRELGEITKGLKDLAKRLDCAVILLCQLNRELEKREDKRPQLSDLRASGEIEEDADAVVFVYRPAYYLERSKYEKVDEEQKRLDDLDYYANVVELIFAKNRNGPVFNKQFFLDIYSNAIRDMAA
ncbi:MAG TPA: DnaB-like helicase C-terminal domain-containing protein [Hyphomicrobiales bacterium]|nr:DnaB-like helicase C-terminal domain-containing protein [Hyphomicrobiales bacterium]